MVNETGVEFGIVDVLILLSIISLLILPGFILFSESDKGNINDYYKVQNFLKEKIEQVYALDFDFLPVGKTENCIISDTKGVELNLNPSKLENELVRFTMQVNNVPLEFSAVKNIENMQIQHAKSYNNFKSIELFAKWGKEDKYTLSFFICRSKL